MGSVVVSEVVVCVGSVVVSEAVVCEGSVVVSVVETVVVSVVELSAGFPQEINNIAESVRHRNFSSVFFIHVLLYFILFALCLYIVFRGHFVTDFQKKFQESKKLYFILTHICPLVKPLKIR